MEEVREVKPYGMIMYDEARPKKKGKRKPKHIYEALTEDQFLKVLNLTRKKSHYLAFILAYGSGLRISEITKLTPADINLKEHKISIRQAKGEKDRVVNTPKWLRNSHLRHFPFSIKIRAIREAFTNKTKKAGFNSVLYIDKAGKPRYKYHFHCLRSSYCVRALENGVPIHHVQLLMGHENLATTSRYAKANPKDAIQSIIDKGV